MFWYDDAVGFGDVADGVLGQGGQPLVLRQRIEQDAFLHFAQKVHAVEDVAEEVVHLDAHRRVKVVQVRGGEDLLRVAHLDAQCS